MKTSGLTILISGGGSGIGFALAKKFLKAGNKVIICGRNSDTLHNASLELPGVVVARADISSPTDVLALGQSYGGSIDVLINNASVSSQINLVGEPRQSLEHQIREVNINLVGLLRMIDAFLPNMLDRPEAAIINVSSALAFIPDASRPVYSASKAAIHSLSQSLRHQLRKSNVRVFELVPPLTDTAMATEIQGVPKLSPENVASAMLAAMLADRYEVLPGLSFMTRLMSRVAPRFGFAQLNRT